MKRSIPRLLALPALLAAVVAQAQAPAQPTAAPSPPVDLPPPPLDNPGLPALPAPSEIVAASPASDWVAIAASDLLVMTLTPDARGRARRVVIQLMSAPFSQGWVSNIRTLATAHWWDGLSINRVQDNYVVQWGDGDGEDPAKARALPSGLATVAEHQYRARFDFGATTPNICNGRGIDCPEWHSNPPLQRAASADSYAGITGYYEGWPIAAMEEADRPASPGGIQAIATYSWPIHCYSMVGVGRGMSPDTGSGAELYTVIGHAPRHLDRNIAVVGRVIEGIEHLSSLPRGTGPLGFYETPEERVTITSIRLASELPAADQPRMEYLNTSSGSFLQYAEARANRRDPFFIVPAGGADICNIPVPVRRVRTAG